MATQFVSYPKLAGSAPVRFTRNSIETVVTQDTVTPANNRPLPVSLLDAAGNVNTVAVSGSALPTGAATEATLSALNTKVTTVNTGAVTVAASALPTGAATESTLSTLSGKIVAANTAATFSQVTVTVAQTLTAPANAVGFILSSSDANTTSFRYCLGATASATSGIQLQAGRDSGYIPCGVSVSVCAESGSCEAAIQWVRSN